MASEEQIVANRRNAMKSTGPQTAAGKRRSRRNALLHGLTAITVVDTIESATDFKKFERKITSDYAPKTAVECALVARLVSLLWRLRRATLIESGLLQSREVELKSSPGTSDAICCSDRQEPNENFTLVPVAEGKVQPAGLNDNSQFDACAARRETFHAAGRAKIKMAASFLKVSDLNGCVFERLGRYERNLWRQALQIILLLNSDLRASERKYPGRRRRHRQDLARPFFPGGFFERN